MTCLRLDRKLAAIDHPCSIKDIARLNVRLLPGVLNVIRSIVVYKSVCVRTKEKGIERFFNPLVMVCLSGNGLYLRFVDCGQDRVFNLFRKLFEEIQVRKFILDYPKCGILGGYFLVGFAAALPLRPAI